MKISIITINYNNANGLQKTIDSVMSQTYPNIEYIVVDGGSTDESLEIIGASQDNISYWVSEPDNGIYHAMNKGIEKANGNYLLFLNSGDSLANEFIISKVVQLGIQEDFIYGNQYLNGHFLKKYPEHLTLDFFLKDTLPHQSTFIKKSVFNIVGFFDNKYKIANDYKFFLEAIFKYNLTYKHHDITITNFDMEGLSNQKSGDVLQEFTLIQQEVFRNSFCEMKDLIRAKDELQHIKNDKVYTLILKLRVYCRDNKLLKWIR